MKRNHLCIYFVFALLMAFFSNSALADVIQKKDTVTGIVIDKKKQPLPGAKVEIMGQPYSAFTDFDGRFNIKCEPGAKKVRVTYPKLKEAKKKIKPDMTVQIGRSWRQAPEKYQWFVGANIGLGTTILDFESRTNFIYDDDYVYDYDYSYYGDDFLSPTISVMAGRVKTVGWYLKAFVNPKTKMTDPYDSDIPDNRCSNAGLILGGMVRLGCPLHLYLGGGFAYTDFTNVADFTYDHYTWQFDMGLLFRIKDNFGINMSMNIGTNNQNNYYYASFVNLGVCYFFNK